MKVIHKDQEHVVSFSSDKDALLIDLCFAGACSDLLPSTSSAMTGVRRFVAQLQEWGCPGFVDRSLGVTP